MADLTLAELGVTRDPGTDWHPRADKAEARNAEGNLVDLDDDQVLDHQAKPETGEQPDAGVLLAAEDSQHSPKGVV